MRDALFDRANTGDNTPAFCELKLVPGTSATLHVLLKGGGSDNASRVVMLPPGAGANGVRRHSIACAKAAQRLPALVIGLGGWAPPSTRWRDSPSTPFCARWAARP